MTTYNVAANTTIGGIVLSANDALNIYGTANSTVNNGGWESIYSGGVANHSTINLNGWEDISSGGVAIHTTVNDGGYVRIYAGAVVSNIIVNSGGYVDNEGGILSGGNFASGATIDGLVVSNGTVDFNNNSANILDGITLQNGVWIRDLTITSSAIINGFGANDGKVFGENLTLSDGGETKNTTLIWQSSEKIYSGGVANNTTIYRGGEEDIYSGGVASGITVSNEGNLYIYAGATVNNVNLTSGGEVTIEIGSGTYTDTNNNYVLSGVQFNPSANISLVLDSGATIKNFANLDNLTINAGAVASNTTVNGEELIASGGVAINTTVTSGFLANELIFSGGVASHTTIESGGTLSLYLGGKVVDPVFDNGASVFIQLGSGVYDLSSSQQVISGIHLNSEITLSLDVTSGAVVKNFVNNRNIEVDAGGVTNNTIDNNFEFVLSGGVANHTIVNGYLDIDGGQANNTTLNSGSWLDVKNGGIANNTTLNNGASLEIETGSLATVKLGSDWTAENNSYNNGTKTININKHNLDISGVGAGTGIWNISDSAKSHATISASATGIQHFTFAASDKDTLILAQGESSATGTVYDSIKALGSGDQISYSTHLSTHAKASVHIGSGEIVKFDGNGNVTFAGTTPSNLTSAENEIITAYSHTSNGVNAGEFADFKLGTHHYLFIIGNSGETAVSAADSLIELTGVNQLSVNHGLVHI